MSTLYIHLNDRPARRVDVAAIASLFAHEEVAAPSRRRRRPVVAAVVALLLLGDFVLVVRPDAPVPTPAPAAAVTLG